MTKPKEILELEQFYKIKLNPAKKLEDIHGFDNGNTYFINGKNEIVGLNLRSNNIIDIKPLERLTALTNLDLSFNKIIDIKPLEDLTALTKLYLSRNKIIDISPLERLTVLTDLYLSENKIAAIKPLERLTALTSLDLYQNKIIDLKPLEGLTALTNLYLSINQIIDIKPLEGLTALTDLHLYKNQIIDIKPLERLTALTDLDLSYNQIFDIKPLERLTALTDLDLSSNQIIEIKPLERLTALTNLDLSVNKIIHIKPLERLTALTYLEISNNPFLDTIELKLDLGKNHLNDIKSYWSKQAEKNKIEVTYPAKVLMLGNSDAGKSTFVDYFIRTKVPKNINEKKRSTPILEIHQYKKDKKNHKLPKAVLFDFGGQDYYHGVYKAFLTNKAINVLFWRKENDTNAIAPDRENKALMNQNFSRNYWLHQLDYYFGETNNNASDKDSLKDREDQTNFLVQTHADKEPRENFAGSCNHLQIENEFYIALKNEALKTTSRQKSLDYFEHCLIEKIEEKQNKLEQPQWYIDFLGFINDYKGATAVEITVLEKYYQKSKDGTKYLETDLNQLCQQGLILYYRDNKKLKNKVWLNPTATIKDIHDNVLAKNIITDNKGKVGKQVFEDTTNEDTIALLVENKVIYLDETDTDKPMYIIPGYLPLAKDTSEEYFIFADFENVNFVLKFKNFIPFGFINQLICKYGGNPEKKMYWRNQLLFTTRDKGAKVLIQMDFCNLEIKFTIKTRKTGVNVATVERELFEDILSIYGVNENSDFSNKDNEKPFKLKDDGDRLYSYLTKQGNENTRKHTSGKNMNEKFARDYLTFGTPEELEKRKAEFSVLPKTKEEIKIERRKNLYLATPKDMYLSVDGKSFVHCATLNDKEKTQSKITSYGLAIKTETKKDATTIEIRTIDENKTKEQSSGLYKNFTTNENAKSMKKIFISYSKHDDKYKKEFVKHLITLKDENLVDPFNCDEIDLGENSHEVIQKKLSECDFMVALVSIDLLNTKYIRDFEIDKAEELGKKIIPIIIKPCDWETSKLGKYHASLRGSNISLDNKLILKGEIKETTKIERTAFWVAIIKEFRTKLFSN